MIMTPAGARSQTIAEMQSVALRCPAPHSPRDLMQVTAGEGVREECRKGRLNSTGVFALVRGQVSPGDERIESRAGHANRPSWCQRH
jgi:hypothetical protein